MIGLNVSSRFCLISSMMQISGKHAEGIDFSDPASVGLKRPFQAIEKELQSRLQPAGTEGAVPVIGSNEIQRRLRYAFYKEHKMQTAVLRGR